MTKLLFDESPLVVQPTLAKAIGLPEAIVLQQINYWLNLPTGGKVVDGRKWIFNSLSEWQTQFPFFSESTIYRTLENLEWAKLIDTGVFNKRKGDKTKWYTINQDTVNLLSFLIDYEKELEILEQPVPFWNNLFQNGTAGSQNGTTLPEITTETNAEIGVPPDASELPSEDEVVGEENDAQAAWDAMESATKTPYNPDGVTEALTVLCETDKILTASRFSKKHRAKLSDLLARDPTREAFDEARESFPKAVMDGKAYASPDVFLGFYATAIDTLRIRSPIYSQEKQEFERPAPRKAVYDHDDMEF